MSTPTVHPAIDPAVLFRVRQHVIEYLDLAASFDEQRAYQRRSPGVNVPGEVLHQWEDWLTEDWQQRYADPAFSDGERAAMLAYHQIIVPLANGAVDSSQELEYLCGTPLWQGLRAAAAEALAIFMVRGQLPAQAQAS
ncbi:MAG: hypothetical protein V4634_03020 [Pseudomonadota bacterium]